MTDEVEVTEVETPVEATDPVVESETITAPEPTAEAADDPLEEDE